MKRRNLFGIAVAAIAGMVLGRKPEIRYVQFNPPRESPAIHWMHGHVTAEEFAQFGNVLDWGQLPADQIKRGWGTRKMEGIGMYLSDAPQPNFEPITYWIPADYIAMEATA